MNTQINSSLELLYPSFHQFPNDIYTETSGLIMQSKQLLGVLKPTEEVARVFICTLIATEKYEVSLNLSAPDLKKSPVPPRVLTKLIQLFRDSLRPGSGIVGSSPKKSPRKRKIVESPRVSKPTNINVTSHQDIAKIAQSTETAIQVSTSPKKKVKYTRGGPKSGDPKKSTVIQICTAMGIAPSSIEAIIKSYKQGCNLVKDRWGLLCGIIVVVARKSHPNLFDNGHKGFYNKLVRISHKSMTIEKLEEWVEWSSQIVTDQSWIKRVTDPNSIDATYKVKNKKYSSGIGNMITGPMSFSNEKKIQDYELWCSNIRKQIKS